MTLHHKYKTKKMLKINTANAKKEYFVMSKYVPECIKQTDFKWDFISQ